MPNTVLVVGKQREQIASPVGDPTGVKERRVPSWDQVEGKRQLA